MSKSLYLVVVCSAALLVAAVLGGCDDKGGAVGYAAAVKQAIGPDVKDYQALSYPTNSFGVATVYAPSTTGKTVRDEDFLCETWKCLGVDVGATPSDADAVLRLRVRSVEYAAVGGGGPVKLDTNSSNDYAFKVALPKIAQVLNLGVGLDSKSATKVDLELGPATKRLLNKPDFVAYINGTEGAGPTKTALQQAFAQGALVVVVGDVVVKSVKATITASKELAPQVDAKLGGLVSKVFSDAEASFKVTKKSDSTYEVESVGPVIALRLLRAQPGAGLLGAQTNWDDWSVVEGPTAPTMHAAP